MNRFLTSANIFVLSGVLFLTTKAASQEVPVATPALVADRQPAAESEVATSYQFVENQKMVLVLDQADVVFEKSAEKKTVINPDWQQVSVEKISAEGERIIPEVKLTQAPSATKKYFYYKGYASFPVEIHMKSGTVRFTGWDQEALVHADTAMVNVIDQKGPFKATQSKGTLNISNMKNNLWLDVNDVNVNVVKSQGDMKLQSTKSRIKIDQWTGALNGFLNAGNIDIKSSTGKVKLNSATTAVKSDEHQGSFGLQSSAGSLEIGSERDLEASIKADKTSVSILKPQLFGLNLVTDEGEIYAPPAFKINRSDKRKSFYRKIEGGGMITVKSQDGVIRLK